MMEDQQQEHHCNVCGQRLANKKLSETGCVTCICEGCAALSEAERGAMLTIDRIFGMCRRYIVDEEITWLRNCLNDPCRMVREAARSVYNMKFQKRKRGDIEKDLTVVSLEFFLCGEVWQEGGAVSVRVHIIANQDGNLKLIDCSAPEAVCEKQITIEKAVAQEFLKSLIHKWDILFWNEDLDDCGPSEDPFLDAALELFGLATEDSCADDPPVEPLWSVKLKLNNGDDREIVFYHSMYSEPQELYWALTNFFEQDDCEECLL